MTDAEFLRAFFEIKFGKEYWTHEALLLKKHGDFEKALDEARAGIMSFNDAVGARVGYHETITRAYLALIQKAEKFSSSESWAFFLKTADPELLKPGLVALRQFYSPDRLWSAEAKTRFLEPDLKPLP